jgi:hypothetical protein
LTIEFTRTQQGNNPCDIEQSTFDKSTPVSRTSPQPTRLGCGNEYSKDTQH